MTVWDVERWDRRGYRETLAGPFEKLSDAIAAAAVETYRGDAARSRIRVTPFEVVLWFGHGSRRETDCLMVREEWDCRGQQGEG